MMFQYQQNLMVVDPKLVEQPQLVSLGVIIHRYGILHAVYAGPYSRTH